MIVPSILSEQNLALSKAGLVVFCFSQTCFQAFGFSQAAAHNWHTEGMAYSLSMDSRQDLADPGGKYRSQFEQWYGMVGGDGLWQGGRKI
jgi:hypothetical protein